MTREKLQEILHDNVSVYDKATNDAKEDIANGTPKQVVAGIGCISGWMKPHICDSIELDMPKKEYERRLNSIRSRLPLKYIFAK